MKHAVKYNRSYLNGVSVTPPHSSFTFISERREVGAKIQIYSPESQVEQEKEDAGKREEGNLFLHCCKTQRATSLRTYMYHNKLGCEVRSRIRVSGLASCYTVPCNIVLTAYSTLTTSCAS